MRTASRGLRSKHTQFRTSARGEVVSSPLDAPMTAPGIKRRRSDRQQSRESSHRLRVGYQARVPERVRLHYHQKRTSALRRDGARTKVRAATEEASRIVCQIRQCCSIITIVIRTGTTISLQSGLTFAPSVSASTIRSAPSETMFVTFVPATTIWQPTWAAHD
jgi:hypothetical protein